MEGETFADRLRYVVTFNEVADTNLEAVCIVICFQQVTFF